MDELQLIAGCKAHKRESQKALYEMYSRKIYGICLRYCSDPESAQDLLHDGFIKVFDNISSYSGKGSFEGWLKRIFINMALENIRKNKSFFHNSEDIQNIPELVDESTEEGTSLISEQELLKMIQQLPKGYRTVFNLYAIEELSHKEIAQMLGINEVTSRSQYNRARQILQHKIKEFLHRAD
ncbi:RNA polymerase sigma factor [Dysgonomonas sp. 520]|uniref:RNA polymerase sigma factor n=1 Tax=Dysgonomonas sp. 520 TaxID=2302931 RepID=UPI0013D72390|nr:sigma-70 family RNA polymerase sigma factor [Dysgonomonas sp. 520]NDW09124.1 sigma-70 family RNA polymerase sigma factor [Dysgonomonas sp. 520]